MTALVTVETVLLVLLVVLVAGLLRSHAEILRRLGPGEASAPDATAGDPASGLTPAPARRRDTERRPAPALSGLSPAGDALALDFTGGAGMLTLLAFLSTGCGTCAGFWETLSESRLPAAVQTVIVTRGRDRERPARVAALAPDGIPVVMSSEAWQDYEIPGAPYFVLVSDAVLGEGVATTWTALASLVGDAVEDERMAEAEPRAAGGGSGGPARARRIEDTLLAAGIGPGHPSLYPGGGDPAELPPA